MEQINLNNQTDSELEQEKSEKLKKYKITCKIIKVISIIAFIAVTAILAYWLIDSALIADEKNRGLSLAFFLVFGAIIVGGIGYIGTIVFSIIGLVLSAISVKYGGKKTSTIFYIVMIVLPIIAEATFIICAKLI